MENQTIKHNFKFRNNNSFIYINNTPKILRLSKTPIISNMKIDKKNINQKKLYTNEKLHLKKKPFINFNFNLIQNRNLNNKKIRTITPNLRLRELVNQKFRENNIQNINNNCTTELPAIVQKNLNNNYQNKNYKSYNNTESNIKKKETNDNINKQLKLIFVMKNKINELNKVIKNKNQEIISIKNNNNPNNNEIINQKNAEKEKQIIEEKNKNINTNNIITENKKENKNISNKDKENNLRIKNLKNVNQNSNNNSRNKKRLTPINTRVNEAEKLCKEIQNLNKIINNLDEKYQQEIKKNKEANQKYNFIKNCTFGVNVPTVKIDEKIKNYENKIIDLEEQLFQFKQQENKKDKQKIILSNEEYSNIQMCLNALLVINNIKEENILNNIDIISFENTEKISTNICDLLNISDNHLISSFLNDYIIKNKKNVLFILTFDELFKYNISNDNLNNNLISFIKERSISFDYKKRGNIPIYYLRHIYNEFCYKNKKQKNEQELFDIIYICKKRYVNHLFNSINDIYYNNLISNEKEKKIENDNINDSINDEKTVKNFIESILEEEFEKCKENEKSNKLVKDKSHRKKKKKYKNQNNNNINDKYNNNNSDEFII